MSNTVWVRLGATVTLDQPINSYKSVEDFTDAIAEAIRAKNFRADGETYVPEPVMDDLAEDLGFEWEGGELEMDI